jgi:hypothetical protein
MYLADQLPQPLPRVFGFHPPQRHGEAGPPAPCSSRQAEAHDSELRKGLAPLLPQALAKEWQARRSDPSPRTE